ncbi:membrane protein [Cohnella kolymensis]|uniref:Membrane protein n=1 Tax=Cohnella kolymensis TaxID=1590652 RepID=A0ABR5A900_9BACL|nr:DMT family transporter [Cohnella kolymensis]KIL37498.1 membrane protein [Cohnella kolymensis]
MLGIIYAVIAGVVVACQSIFNVRISERAGFWFTNTWVHGTGFLLSLILFWILKDGSLGKLESINKMYLLTGCMGVLIVYSVMHSVGSIGPVYAIAILLIAQLLAALAIDTLGWFGVERVALSANRIIGIGVMIAGVIIFKLK